MKFNKLFFFLVSGLFISATVAGQTLTANAGNNTMICPGTTYTVGGTPTATGGIPPYTYHWTPNVNISNVNVANPIVNPTVPTWYFVRVTDSTGASKTDSVGVDLNPVYAYDGGMDTSICIGGTATIGGIHNSLAGGVTYSWTPGTALSSTTAPNPISTTTVTITYSVTITSPACPSKSFMVTVTVNPLPTISACCPATILEGESVTLTATGGVLYYWTPGSTISNQSASPTTAEPITTTTYFVIGEDANSCQNWDTVTINVIPSSEIIFYNTFSPNGDGINDYFYIGNAYKYPACRLEVYSRTGQLVYAKTGYDNLWDGTNYGDKLPEATYYFRFDPGDGTATKFGNVTIVR